MKSKKLPSQVVVLILSVITIVSWAFFDILRAFVQKPAPTVEAEVIAPLTPSLDKKVLEEVGTRIYLEESQIPETVLAPTAVEEIPEEIPVEEIIPEENATKEGELMPAEEL